MPGIILSTQCEKVVNKGGGRPTKTVAETIRDAFGREHHSHKHLQSRKCVSGTDYVVFKCPGCGSRNRQSAYRVKGSVGKTLSFKCNRCYREIEVARPTSQVPNIIVAPTVQQGPPIGLVDVRGRPIGRN